MQSEPHVHLRFRPVWTYIDGIREFGRFFCEHTYADLELAERARMVLQETLENAMKYSTRRDDCTLELSIQCSARSIAITCTSEPDPEHLDQLREELAQLCAQDPEAAYVAAFQRASVEPHGSSRLGLARMRYEGKFELEMDDDSDGRIRIRAVSQL